MKIASLLIGIFVTAISVSAQDNNYWTLQYGARSALLGGAVVGDVRDNSAIFYNPGALGFLQNPDISVAATGYQLDILTLKNGAGTNLDLSSTQRQIIPLMTSGLIKLKKYPRHTIGYAFITKNLTSTKYSARNDGFHYILDGNLNPKLSEYIAQYNMKSSLEEYWLGGSYSYKISDHLSAGLTAFIAYREQHIDQSFVARALPPDTTSQTGIRLISVDEIQSLSFWNLRYITKVGVAADYDKIKLGLTITAPSLNLGGNAVIGRDITVSNLDLFGDGFFYSYVADDQQSGLSTLYRSPLSIAIGASFKIRHTQISITGEWFDAVPSYTWVKPNKKDFLRPTGIGSTLNSDQFLRIREGNTSKSNAAIGLEQPLSKRINVYTSFRTNFSVFQKDTSNRISLSTSSWDLYHVTAGITVLNEKSDISLGFSYAFGGNPFTQQPVNIAEPREPSLLSGDLKRCNASFRSFGLIIGYTYHLK